MPNDTPKIRRDQYYTAYPGTYLVMDDDSGLLITKFDPQWYDITRDVWRPTYLVLMVKVGPYKELVGRGGLEHVGTRADEAVILTGWSPITLEEIEYVNGLAGRGKVEDDN